MSADNEHKLKKVSSSDVSVSVFCLYLQLAISMKHLLNVLFFTSMWPYVYMRSDTYMCDRGCGYVIQSRQCVFASTLHKSVIIIMESTLFLIN